MTNVVIERQLLTSLHVSSQTYGLTDFDIGLTESVLASHILVDWLHFSDKVFFKTNLTLVENLHKHVLKGARHKTG